MIPGTAVEPVARTFGMGVLAIVAASAAVAGAGVGFVTRHITDPKPVKEARAQLKQEKAQKKLEAKQKLEAEAAIEKDDEKKK